MAKKTVAQAGGSTVPHASLRHQWYECDARSGWNLM